MADQMQQAREILAAEIGAPVTAGSFVGTLPAAVHADVAIRAISAALRAAPVAPNARVTQPLRADESRQEQADAAIYNRGWNDCRAAMLAARPQGVNDV